MTRAVKPNTRKLLTQGWLSKPEQEILDFIAVLLANGGSLVAVCREEKLLYSDVMLWITDDPKRQRIYNIGMQARDEWAKQRVLDEVRLVGTVDIRDAFKPNGDLKDIVDLPADLARCIQQLSIVQTKNGENVTLKFAPKLPALELLGKQLDMFHSKVDHSADESLADLIKKASETEPAEKTKDPDEVTLPVRGDLKAGDN